MAFEAGDVVILKSGGHPMTVVAVEDNQAECIWTGEEGDLFRETIPTVALEVARELDLDEDGEEAEAEDAPADEERSVA